MHDRKADLGLGGRHGACIGSDSKANDTGRPIHVTLTERAPLYAFAMLDDRLTTDSARHLREDGWVELRTESTDELMYLAASLGDPVPVRTSDAVLTRLMATRQEDARARSLSKRHGFAHFPLHTDCAHHRQPPRWVILRMASPASSCATILTDSLEVLRGTRLLRTLQHAQWIIDPGHRRFLSSVLSTDSDEWRFRYDPGCMRPALPQHGAIATCLEEALSDAQVLRISWTMNQTLIIDNWRMLHGREPIVTNEDPQARILERVVVVSTK